LASSKESTQVVRLFGIWNLFIHLRSENNEEVQKILIDLRDKFEIIDNYEIIPIFEDISINLMPL
jgi:DNA-binding Lrp family transcriptional regulator